MKNKTTDDLHELIQKATTGDKKSLETILMSVQELVFNLSLRMLGTFPDAEDATQEILLKTMTHLSSFRQESSFSTWVFRIAVNHLNSYRKSMFAEHPLSFEYYGYDIEHGKAKDISDLSQAVEQSILAEELKLSCTNVMLQCLDAESRCIFILGTMFRVDSRLAGDILGITPEAYRQRLSRTRKKMADFLEAYCGAYGNGTCSCKSRIPYALETHRLNPQVLNYTRTAERKEKALLDVKNAMEEMDGLSGKLQFCKQYETPEQSKQFLRELLQSTQLSTIRHSEMEDN